MDFFYWKALHFIFVVTWFAGLFYMVRLLIYHREAQDFLPEKKQILTEQFLLMEKRLWYGITYPSCVLTFFIGNILFWKNPDFYLQQTWMQLKIVFLIGLFTYHFYCDFLFRQMKKGIFKKSSFFLRFLNEIATVFLVSIVFTVVLKKNENAGWAILYFLFFSLFLFFLVFFYKKIRKK